MNGTYGTAKRRGNGTGEPRGGGRLHCDFSAMGESLSAADCIASAAEYEACTAHEVQRFSNAVDTAENYRRFAKLEAEGRATTVSEVTRSH